jgi:hypothetical protein
MIIKTIEVWLKENTTQETINSIKLALEKHDVTCIECFNECVRGFITGDEEFILLDKDIDSVEFGYLDGFSVKTCYKDRWGNPRSCTSIYKIFRYHTFDCTHEVEYPSNGTTRKCKSISHEHAFRIFQKEFNNRHKTGKVIEWWLNI